MESLSQSAEYSSSWRKKWRLELFLSRKGIDQWADDKRIYHILGPWRWDRQKHIETTNPPNSRINHSIRSSSTRAHSPFSFFWTIKFWEKSQSVCGLLLYKSWMLSAVVFCIFYSRDKRKRKTASRTRHEITKNFMLENHGNLKFENLLWGYRSKLEAV